MGRTSFNCRTLTFCGGAGIQLSLRRCSSHTASSSAMATQEDGTEFWMYDSYLQPSAAQEAATELIGPPFVVSTLASSSWSKYRNR